MANRTFRSFIDSKINNRASIYYGTLLIIAIIQERGQREATADLRSDGSVGQNIMGFPGGTDKERNARR